MFFIKEKTIDKGVQYVLISIVCFSIMQSLVKAMSYFGSFQHVFIRSVIGWIISVSFLKHQRISLAGKNQKLLIFRGLIGCVSMFGFFYILTRIPFASSISLKYLSPIFATLFAVLFLKEKIKAIQWFFFLISFSGVILLKGLDLRISSFDLGIGILSSVFGGLLYIVIRKIGEDDHHLVILHYFMAISAIISGFIAIPNWKNPSLMEWFGFLIIGFVGFVAQNYFTKSVQVAQNVSLIANIRYIEAALAIIIGYFIFDETYSTMSFVGLAMIFLGLILAVWVKNKK
jgi:drug/metabolite transporter (DMT)-like permease